MSFYRLFRFEPYRHLFSKDLNRPFNMRFECPCKTIPKFISTLKWLSWPPSISVEKSCLVIISNKRATFDYPTFMLADHALQKIDEIKDLGVIIDNRLHFSSHITAVISKAKQRIYLLKKCFVACSVDKLIHGFKVYILPILDYCSPVWSSHCEKDIKRIESVQRLFTKRLSGYENLSYAERLAKTGLCSLEPTSRWSVSFLQYHAFPDYLDYFLLLQTLARLG